MVNENDPEASKLEMAKMSDSIAKLTETVGTIQDDLSKVSFSIDSQVSDIKKMLETLMGKTKVPEDSLVLSDEASLEDDSHIPYINVMEANLSKDQAKAERRAKREQKAKGTKS